MSVLSTPNASEWIIHGTQERENGKNSEILGVDYQGLLNKHKGDKNAAFDELKLLQDEADFNFDLLEFNTKGDKTAAFDTLLAQNSYFNKRKAENDTEKAARHAAESKLLNDIRLLNDENASLDEKDKAQAGYFDYMLNFGGGSKDERENFKNSVVLPFYENKKHELFKDGMPFGDSEEAKIFHQRRQALNDKIKKYKFDLPFENARDDEFSDDELLKALGQKERSFLDIGKDAFLAAWNLPDIVIDNFKSSADIDSKAQAQVSENLRAKATQAAARGEKLTKDDLSLSEQALAYKMAYANGSLDDKINDWTNGIIRRDKNYFDDMIKKGIEIADKEAQIAQTPFEKLNKEQVEYIYDKAGAFNRGWDRIFKDDDEEVLKQEYNAIRGGAFMKLASEAAETIKNFHKNYNLVFNGKEWVGQKIGGSGTASKEALQDYYKELENSALWLGFNGIKQNKKTGEIVFYRTNEDGELETYAILPNGKAYFINHNEFGTNLLSALNSMKGEIGAAVAGASYGFNKGKGVKSKVLNSIAYAAAGSVAGAAVDYTLANYALNREAHAGELIEKMLEAGAMSVLGDAAVLGLGAGIKYAAKNGAKALTAPIEKAASGVSWVIDKSPLVGTFKRMISPEQNLDAAIKMMARNTTPEHKIAIDEAMRQIGGEMKQQPNIAFFQNIADKFRAKFGDENFFTQTAQKWADTISNRSLLQARQDMLNFVRSDESGAALKLLLEVASRSDVVQKNLSTIITHTYNGLKREVENLGVKKADIQAILDEAKIGTYESFGKVMNMIAHSILPDDIFKTHLDTTRLNAFLDTLKNSESIIAESEVTKGTRAKLIERLEKDKEFTFSELRDLEKDLNDMIYNKNLDKGFRRHLANALNNELKAVLRDGVYSLFQQYAAKNADKGGKAIAAKMQDMYNVALRDYADYKNLEKMVQKYKLANEERDLNQVVNALVDIMKGQGSKDGLDQLTRFTKYLSPENREVFEVAVLKKFFDEASYASKEGVNAFDSLSFFNRLKSIDGKGDKIGEVGERLIDKFQSPAAKAVLNYAENFQKAFLKDYEIAYKLTNPAARESSTSILGTDLTRRGLLMAARMGWEWIRRNIGHIPFLRGFNENTQTHAFRYHLDKALREANGLEDFKHILERRVKKAHFNNETMRKYNEFISNVDEAVKNADDLAKMSDDELAQMDKSLGRGTPQPNSNESVTQQSLNKAEIKPKNSAETKLLNEIDPSSLNDEQKAVFEVLTGQKDKIILQGKNLNDLYILERGTRQGGARKIITKHGGVEKTGGLSNDEILDMMKVVREGELDENSFTQHKDFIRYAYDLKDENGLNLRLVVDEYNDGKKVFDFYSNRNFTDYDGQSWQKNENIQMPKKSLLEQARENTERLRAEQEAAQIAQKEAELARLKEMQAKNAEILAQKEAAAGQAINEAQSLEIGTPIKAHKISDTKIIINDNTAPFKAEFIIAKKDDIKPNFERTGTQGRSERQDKVIESIQSDFKPHLIFEQMGGFEGLPIILKDGQVIAGNHRAQAIKGLTGENLARYKQAAKEKFGIDLKDDEVIVRLVKDGDEKELINLAFMSNVGRESNLGEKALANLAKYESNMQNLPNHINADSVFELESQVAKALDTQGNGLNVFDTNLALLSKIAKNSSNTDILESLNTLKSLSQDEKEKVLRMFVSNAGEFHNLAKDTQLKSLNLNDYLADALIIAAKNVDEKTRKANFQSLFSDIQTMLASAKEMLKIDPFLFENFKSKALGYALARFARLENPSAKLFEFLKASKADLENLYTGNIFESNKAISDIDIYDFLKHAINSGEDLIDKQGRNIKGEITSRLDDLRKVENALIDSGDIQFAKSKAKPQGREAKETSINSLFADDELQMQATKPTKELNLSDEKDFNELSEFFKLNSKDKEFNEIFAKATKAAQRLGVKVKFDESAARSHFVLNDNTITIAAGNKELFQAQDLLHELIHATTRKALKDFNESPEQAAKIYTKRQIEAINEIISLYQKSKGIAKRQGKDAYALQNVDEFVAELSSGEFRAFLKAQDIFERFIKALIRFFTGDSERLAKNVNSYKALKESYYKILDDYEPQVVEKSQSQLEFEMAQRQIGELKARKKHYFDIMANAGEKGDDELKAQSKQVIKNIDKEIKNTENKAKLTQKIGKDNLTSDIIKQAEKENKRIIVDKLDSQEAQKLGFDEPEFVAQSVDANEIRHILNEHGVNSNNVIHSKKPAVDENDIANYAKYTDSANEKFYIESNANERAKRVSFKQVNGYYVVVEEVHNGQGELGLKTMFKEKGYYKDGEAYKEISSPQTTSSETTPRVHSISDDKEIIPNSSSQSQGEKEFLSPNGEDIFAKTTPEQRNQIVKGIQGEIDELVKASYEIDGKIKQIVKVANERAEITGRYSRTSGEIKTIDALNKESEKLEKEVYKLQTLQNFFKGDLSNDFWQFLRDFNNEKALKWYEKEINKRVKSVSGDEIQKVSHEVSHINQNNDIMPEISHKGGQDGTSNASNGLNAAEKGMPASEPAGISDGLFSQKQLLDEPRGAGADLSNSPTHRQQPQTLFSQGASEPNASGGQQRGSNERLRTASGDLRGEVSGDGQNLRAQQGLNVSERFGQDRSEQHSRAKHTIRANSGSGASHSNATAQELVSDTNAAGILSPAEKATIENQTFTQTIDPAKFNANEILSANINALKVLDELLITRNLATNEQKELLSAFSGAGGRFSDELNKIRKANPNDERLAYINGLLKQINEKLPKASGEIVDKGLSITDFYARSGDAYFTPTHIIKAMSDLAKKMGLKDESYILEPSAGVGRFLGFFDDKHPYIHAVELDKLSANIARKLYPTAQIENAPFQNSLAARNIGSYDLIIGNPPYANVKIQDKMIHDYFMLKSIENLKENGISIQIVTHNFMDKMSSAKMQIAKNAEFLGGVRLPNDTFKDAKVTTDILVFRKLRADEVGTADTSWTKLSDFENGLKVSSYFKEQKPQNVLGELITQKGQFGDSVGVKSTGFDLENLDLSKFIKESKEAFHTEKMHLASTQLAEPQKTGGFYKENGEIFQNGQKVDLKERLKEYGIDWADSTFEKRIGDLRRNLTTYKNSKTRFWTCKNLNLSRTLKRQR